MRRTLPVFLALVVGITATTSISSAYPAQSYQQNQQAYSDEYQSQADDIDGLDADETGEDDASPIRRVARLRFVEGDVSFLRAGVTEWAPAVENLPLLEGDQLYVPHGARAEIQLSGGSFVRLSDQATLTITELSDLASQFEITEGTAVIVADRLNAGKERLEIDTPNAALILARDGMYRVNIQGRELTDVSVRKGNVEVSTDDGSFRVREGYRLTVDTSDNGQLQLAADTGIDWWNEDWTDRSSGTLTAQSIPDDVTSDVQSYETNYTGFYGASDLSNYGSWGNDSSYGNCWFPRVSSDWAPYRYGQWLWIPSVGWSWLAEERWGWAPYHYGRWAFIPGRGWAWVPGFSRGRGYGHWDYRWRPHLVYFFNSSNPRGRYVGWYPLSPRQRWHRPDWNRRNDHRHLQYPNARDRNRRPGDGNERDRNRRSPRAITAVPIEAFQRPTRSIDRRDLVDRDTTRWVARNVKPGLPEVVPTPVSTRPGADRREARRVLQPSTEVISRPVVTRNRPGNSLAESNVRRERKLLLPTQVQPFETFGRMPNRDRNESDPAHSRKGRVTTGNADSNDNGGDNRARREERMKPRITLPAPADKGNETQSSGNGDQTGDDGKSIEQRRAEKQERKRLRDQEQQQQFSNPASNGNGSQPRVRNENHSESPRARSENNHQPRNEGRSEAKAEAKEERRQEKQQSREERSAQQDKPRKNR
jgi:hypothetical protein